MNPEMVALESRVEALQIKVSDLENNYKTIVQQFETYVSTQTKLDELRVQQIYNLQIKTAEIMNLVKQEPAKPENSWLKNFLI